MNSCKRLSGLIHLSPEFGTLKKTTSYCKNCILVRAKAVCFLLQNRSAGGAPGHADGEQCEGSGGAVSTQGGYWILT